MPAASASSSICKNRKSHDIVQQGAPDPRQPGAPRRLRLRGEHRRRRRHPRADAAPLPAPGARHAWAFRLPRAGRLRRRHGLPAAPTRRPRAGCEATVRADRPRGGAARPRLARRADRQLADRPDAPATPSRSCGRSSSAARACRPDRTRERRPGLRAQALRHPQAASRTPCASRACAQRDMFYVPSLSCKTLIYKGMLNAGQVRPYLPRPARPGHGDRPWRWSIRASAPTRFPAGRGRIRTATSPTTAKSTRCAATSTGCTPARACSPRELFGDDIKKILPIIDAERQRLGDVRQRPGTAGPGRPVAAARRHDDDPGAVERRRDA